MHIKRHIILYIYWTNHTKIKLSFIKKFSSLQIIIKDIIFFYYINFWENALTAKKKKYFFTFLGGFLLSCLQLNFT